MNLAKNLYDFINKSFEKVFGSFLFLLVFIFFIRTFIVDYSVVPSESATKTLCTGNGVLVNKMIYRIYSPVAIPVIGRFFARNIIVNNSNIKRGDYIVFCHRDNDGKYYTKRVIGLPGDVVEYDDLDVVINGESTMFKPDGTPIFDHIEDFEMVHDDHQKEVLEKRICRIPVEGKKCRIINTLHKKDRPSKSKVKYKVPDGYILGMGDNRNFSYDCRFHNFGDIQQSYVIGRISHRLFTTKASFKREVSWLQFIVELPYRVLRYGMYMTFKVFGNINNDICDIDDLKAQQHIIDNVLTKVTSGNSFV